MPEVLLIALLLPVPPTFVTDTVGAVPPVSKINPAGALSTIVLLPVVVISPVAFSA